MQDQPVPPRTFRPPRDIVYGVLLGIAITLCLLHPWNVDRSDAVDYSVDVICPDGYVKHIAEKQELPHQVYTVDCERDTAGTSQSDEIP
jgi:hypothetical protein